MVNVSIVIPTYNRCQILSMVLKSIESQDYPKENYEVIVSDDGSQDDTESFVRGFLSKTKLQIRYLKLAHFSSPYARNAAIKNSRYELIISIDDDIILTQDFIKEHVRIHRQHNFSRKLVVLGYINWPPFWEISPFMKYIIEKGPLYGYGLINPGMDLPFSCLYSANFSINRNAIMEQELLDESFSNYFQDSELGYRLKKNGFSIILNEKAVGYHFHPTSISSFMKRQELAGFSAVKFFLKHPELKEVLFFQKNNRSYNSIVAEILALLFAGNPGLNLNALREKFYSFLLNYSYNRGAKRGFRFLSNSKKFIPGKL